MGGAILAASVRLLVAPAPGLAAAQGDVHKSVLEHHCGLFTLPGSDSAKRSDEHKKRTHPARKPLAAPVIPAPPPTAPPAIEIVAPPASPFDGSWRIHSTQF